MKLEGHYRPIYSVTSTSLMDLINHCMTSLATAYNFVVTSQSEQSWWHNGLGVGLSFKRLRVQLLAGA